MELLKRFWKEEDGQDLIEYGMLAGCIIVLSAGMLVAIGNDVNTLFTRTESRTTQAVTGS